MEHINIIDNMEVTEGTDAGSGLVVDHEELAAPEEVVTATEEGPEAEGEAPVEAGAGDITDVCNNSTGSDDEDTTHTDTTQPSTDDGSDATVPVVEEVVGTPDILSDLPLCETEDSDNCIWDAQNMGNGEGHSFYVIDGEVTYLEGTPEVEESVFNDEGWLKVPSADLAVVCAEDPTWWECELSVFDENGWLKQPSADLETVCAEDDTWWECELLEDQTVVEADTNQATTVATVATAQDSAVPTLAVTGGLDMLMPILVGSVLLLGGAAMFIRKKFTPKA